MNFNSLSLKDWYRTPLGLCLIVSAAVATLYLVFAHTVHVLGVLPYLILLLCPALHLLMHGGHSQHEGHQGKEQGAVSQSSKESPGCH